MSRGYFEAIVFRYVLGTVKLLPFRFLFECANYLIDIQLRLLLVKLKSAYEIDMAPE